MHECICSTDKGIYLGDLFNNHNEIKDLLRSHLPDVREGLIDGLFESSVKLIYVSNLLRDIQIIELNIYLWLYCLQVSKNST